MMMMMMIQGARLHSIVPSTKVCSLVLLLLLLGVLSLFTTTLPRSGSLAAREEEEEEEEEKNVDSMCVCVCVINVSNTQNERDTKSVSFFPLFSFFKSVCLFPPFFDWLLVLLLHFPPPFSFFFVDNDTLNGTPFTKQKKREKKNTKKEGKKRNL